MTDQPQFSGPPLPPIEPDADRNRLILVIIAVVVVVGLVIAGVLIATSSEDDSDPAVGASEPVGCGEVISKPVGTTALHLTPGETAEYPDAPPAFGNHSPVPAGFGRPFYSADRPAVEELVHNLEHGYTIAWYDETAAADEVAINALKEIAFAYQQSGERFIAAPWTSADGDAFPDDTHIAVTRWSADPANPAEAETQLGNWMYCGTVDPDAIEVFFETWPNDESAEPGLY